jgi:feruloyl esterase
VVSSDFGHQASNLRDASFGLDPQARIDWGYNAIAQVTASAKSLIVACYGRAPRYSYYAGCSGGGRQALVASQRFASDFDGILASAPILEQHLAQTVQRRQDRQLPERATGGRAGAGSGRAARLKGQGAL